MGSSENRGEQRERKEEKERGEQKEEQTKLEGWQRGKETQGLRCKRQSEGNGMEAALREVNQCLQEERERERERERVCVVCERAEVE